MYSPRELLKLIPCFHSGKPSREQHELWLRVVAVFLSCPSSAAPQLQLLLSNSSTYSSASAVCSHRLENGSKCTPEWFRFRNGETEQHLSSCPAHQSHLHLEESLGLGQQRLLTYGENLLYCTFKFSTSLHLSLMLMYVYLTPPLPLRLVQAHKSRAIHTHTDSISSTNLQDQLHHFCMDQPMHRLTIDMGDEVTLTKPCLTGWTAILHMLPQEEKSL